MNSCLTFVSSFLFSCSALSVGIHALRHTPFITLGEFGFAQEGLPGCLGLQEACLPYLHGTSTWWPHSFTRPMSQWVS